MSIVQNSLDVAHAYLDEHGQVIRTDIVNMAKDLDDAAAQVGAATRRKFRELMFAQAGLRDLPVAYVVDAKGAVKVAVLEDESIPYVAPPEHLIRAAEGGQVPLLMPVKLQAGHEHPYGCCRSIWSAMPSAVASPPSPSCTTIRTPISTSRAASTPRSCGTCGARRRACRVRELQRARGGLKFAHGLCTS